MSETKVTAVSSTPKKPRGRRPQSLTKKITTALKRGDKPIVIAKRFGVSSSHVYSIRNRLREEEKTQGTGIASLATLPPTSASGIGAYGRPSVPPGTIVYTDPAPTPAEAATEVASAERPTLWQRIKLYVRGKK